MRLLLFNLATDVDDPILGFTTRWICALAERVESVHVITMREGHHELPANVRVHSVGKERGYSEPHRVLEFYRLLYRISRSGSIDACFSHMMPRFTILAAPVLKPLRIPIVTWYAHPSATYILKLAHHVSDRVVTSIATSYPYKRDKLAVIGHGINTDDFTPGAGTKAEEGLMILCVGRLSPAKNHPTLLKAAYLLRRVWVGPFRIVILGGPAVSTDRPYVQSLREQVKQLGLEETVFFEPPVSRDMLPSWYRRCAVHVNLTPKGFVDKVALEAMACGKPSLVATEGFKETLGEFSNFLVFRHGDAQHLAEKLSGVLRLSARERVRIGCYLRDRVARMHSLDHLAQRLVEILEETKQDREKPVTRQLHGEKMR